jgi:phosphoribosylformylglycinamidine cyclo-ligase
VRPPDDVDRALAVLTARHVPSWVLGAVARAAEAPPPDAAPGSRVRLQGDHPRF